eukprot:scaffold37539_cov90-Isochrysis_galbana.AAC.1
MPGTLLWQMVPPDLLTFSVPLPPPQRQKRLHPTLSIRLITHLGQVVRNFSQVDVPVGLPAVESGPRLVRQLEDGHVLAQLTQMLRHR